MTRIKNQKEIDALYEGMEDKLGFIYHAYFDDGSECIGYCQFETDNCPVSDCGHCPWFASLIKIEKEEVPD